MWALVSVLIAAANPSAPPQRIIDAHRTCTRLRSESACQLALELYPPYLAVHPGDVELHFFFAELLWSRDRFLEAAEQYHHVARTADPRHRYAKLAAYDEILALQKAAKRTPHRFDGQPWPLTVEQQRLVDAIDFHLARWPNELTDELTLVAIGLHLDAHDFSSAERRIVGLSDPALSRVMLDDLRDRRTMPLEPVGQAVAVGAPDTIGQGQTVGEGQTIGEPQTIGEGQDIGWSQSIGPCSDEDCPIEDLDDTEVELTSERRSYRLRRNGDGPDTEASDPSEYIIY